MQSFVLPSWPGTKLNEFYVGSGTSRFISREHAICTWKKANHKFLCIVKQYSTFCTRSTVACQSSAVLVGVLPYLILFIVLSYVDKDTLCIEGILTGNLHKSFGA